MTSKDLFYANHVSKLLENFVCSKYINGFSYSKVFQNGARVELWTDFDAMKYTILDKKYTHSASHAPDVHKNTGRYFFLDDEIKLIDDRCVKRNYQYAVDDQRTYFNHDNAFLIAFYNDHFAEYFCFCGPQNNYQTRIFILNNLDKLERFTSYFKVSSAAILKDLDSNPLVKPRFIVESIHLTPLEKRVARVLSCGYTYKETSSLLNIGLRTVHSYVEQLKGKFNVFNKKDLIEKINKSYKRG